MNKFVYIVVIFFLCVDVKFSLSLYNDIITDENSSLSIKLLTLFTSLVNKAKESKLNSNSKGGEVFKSLKIRLIFLSNKS